jgi:hypothetical protein
MACTTTINGVGADCSGQGGSNGITYNLTYDGKVSLTTVSSCGYSWSAPKMPDGTTHPSHRFSTINSITYSSDCNGGVSPNQKYDCVNGGCVPAATYGTAGSYANLAACQSGCAKNSPCKGECVESAELAALQQAANQLQARNCK